jgi:beta-1,4-N-acetylglucosaminyltransferase
MKIALVCTRGGHLTETLQLLGAFHDHEFFFVVPHSPRDEELRALAPVYIARSVDARLWPFIQYSFWALSVLLREKPEIVLSMGPEVALPFFFWGKLFGKKTIYIESWCRVNDLSLTGCLVYFWVDEFWVQWPQLVRTFPRAKYFGSVV